MRPDTFALSLTILVSALSCQSPGVEGPGTAGGVGSSAPGSGGRGGGAGNGAPSFVFNIPEGGAARAAGPDGGEPEKVCGREDYKLDSLPPEIVVVLDRSKTMGFPIEGNASTRWQEVTRALDAVIKDTEGGILWGLKVFPTNGGCEISDKMEVEVALQNYATLSGIMTKISPNQGASGTPMQAALRKATAYLKARTTPNQKYLLLGTDGLPACGNNQPGAEDSTATIAAIADAKAAGIKSFIVGIATHNEGATAEKVLSEMAEAGGEPRAVEPKYFPVMNRTDLLKTLTDITGKVASCVFPIDKAPPSPNDVYVKVDGKKVEKDAANGWILDQGMKNVLFNGTACEAVKKGKADGVQDVQIIFGCPGMIIE